jgi:Protein of unknown function (DUF2934)
MDADWLSKIRARAYAIWERLGRPEGAADQHWTQAEEEFRAEEQGRAGAPVTEAEAIPADAASTAGTETWTGQGGSVGGEPRAGDRGEARMPVEAAAKVIGKTGHRARADKG